MTEMDDSTSSTETMAWPVATNGRSIGDQNGPRLTLRLLGEIEVVRGDKSVALPSSRKARALLAYLAVTRRPQRRDRLCSMFWDIADDPRGALRSSLSMLRPILDGPQQRRIVTEHDSVRFDCTDAEIDLLAVRRALTPSVIEASTEELERAAASFRGEFAEGLDVSNCPDFQAWCMAEREEKRRLQVLILKTLIERHATAPEAALPHARALVGVDVAEASAHITFLRLLVANGRQREAKDQREVSLRLLGETSVDAALELGRAWRSIVGRPVASDHTCTPPPLESGRLPKRISVTVEARLGKGPHQRAEPVAPAEPDTHRAADSGRRHIVVLPFINMSGDAGQEYFADGITEDIITDLSRVSALFVIPRNSACKYKGKTVEIGEIVQKLNVRHILQGSVRKAAHRIRINVQLIDGATGDHLWAERFDRDVSDIFALQDDISKTVVAALKLKLLPAGRVPTLA
jgi:TolB-like protein/DNA-binding SARP family transcriptional activator